MRRRAVAGLGCVVLAMISGAIGPVAVEHLSANAARSKDIPLAPLARLTRQREIIDDAAKIIGDRLATLARQRDQFAQAASIAVLAPMASHATATMPSLEVARQRGFAAYVLGRYRRDLAASQKDAARMVAARQAAVVRQAELTAALATPMAKLRWPSAGAVISEFGTRYDAEHRLTLASRGMEIAVMPDATPAGGQAGGGTIRAPGDGTVRYAGPLQGLGKVVVLDHGALLSVIGGMQEVQVHTGEYIARSAPIGTAQGSIYLEARLGARAGIPVDPRPYFATFPSK